LRYRQRPADLVDVRHGQPGGDWIEHQQRLSGG
jgi:hypothetical protein